MKLFFEKNRKNNNNKTNKPAGHVNCCFIFLICWLPCLPLNATDESFALYSSECQNYQSLTSGNRKITYGSGLACDDTLGPGWFRFQGAAGTRMPTSCPPQLRCGTAATGWLNGVHPTVADGRVTRQVCFSYVSTCCWMTTNIQVRNCGSYYVYYFNGTPGCQLRYCSTD